MRITTERRRQNTVLAALERLRRLCPAATLGEAVVFLYVCENEGINVRELAQLASMTHSTASRTARRLISRDSPFALAPYLGLIDMQACPNDGRGRTLHLSATGAELRGVIEALISEARAITPDRSDPRADRPPL